MSAAISKLNPAHANWARFVELDRKGRIPESLKPSVAPELAAALMHHRHALIVQVAIKPKEPMQLAFAFGPVGLVCLRPTSANNKFTDADLRALFSATRLKDPASRAALKAFLGALDGRVLEALRRAHALDSETYNWCLIDPERRSAAIAAYPAFANFLKQHLCCEMTIALSGNLQQTLARVASLSPAVIRHVGRNAPTLFGDDLAAVTQVMDDIPQSLWPKSRRDVLAIDLAKDLVDSSLGGSSRERRAAIVSTLKSPDRSWLALDRWSFTRDADDAASSLIQHLLLPLLIGRGEPIRPREAGWCWHMRNPNHTANGLRQRIKLVIAGMGGIPALKRFSDAWHARYQTLGRSDTGNLPVELELVHLLHEEISIDGVRYRPLDTVESLRRESAELGHCIQTYAQSAIRGQVFAFACDGCAGRFTMTLTRTNGSLYLDDARGPDNATSEAWTEAAHRLLKHFQETEAKPTGGEKMAELVARASGPEAWLKNRAVAEAIVAENFERWMIILPARLRARTPEDLAEGELAALLRQRIGAKPKRGRSGFREAA